MVRCSKISATSTKRTITRAVKISPMTSAAIIAIVIDSSMVIRRAAIASKAFRKMG